MGSYTLVSENASDHKTFQASDSLSQKDEKMRFYGQCSRIAPVPFWKRILPQVLSSFSMSLICLNIGITLSFPTLVVDEMRNGTKNSSHNLLKPSFFTEFQMDDDQTSLYVGLAYLCQPIGSIFGGWAIEMIGRKKLMILVNVPFTLGWIVLFFSQSPEWMYISNFLLGMGIGLCEGTFATYIPETCEPFMRGILVGKVLFVYSISIFMPYLVSLGLPDWRWCGLALAFFPVLSFFVSSAIPETPHWLASRGMLDRAEKALLVLRGGSHPEHVQTELQELIQYQKEASYTVKHSSRWEAWKEKLLYMASFRMRSPFLLICNMFIIAYLSGPNTMRPYLGPIFEQMENYMDIQKIGMYVSLSGVLGGLVCFLVIKFSGKKFLLMVALLAGCIISIILALTELRIIGSNTAIYSFCVFSFFNSLGVHPIPWMMQGDLFPFRGRGLASGMAAAFNYIVGFICTRLFLTVMNWITLTGVFFLFSACNMIGCVYLWFCMPETEGKSHQEIDKYYNGLINNKKQCRHSELKQVEG